MSAHVVRFSNRPSLNAGDRDRLPQDVWMLEWAELARRFERDAADEDFELVDLLMRKYLADAVQKKITFYRYRKVLGEWRRDGSLEVITPRLEQWTTTTIDAVLARATAELGGDVRITHMRAPATDEAWVTNGDCGIGFGVFEFTKHDGKLRADVRRYFYRRIGGGPRTDV